MPPSEQCDWADVPERLREGARQLGLSIQDKQANQLLSYLTLLGRWNGVHNLSAWKEPFDLLVHHVFDSMTLIGPLRRYGAGRPLSILDAGSGPGFPAAPLAVMSPNWSVTAADAVAKKIAFVRQAAAESGIRNLFGLHTRLEDATPSELFDVVVSRALGSIANLALRTGHLLKPAGIWVAQKGRLPQHEIDALSEGLQVFHVEPVTTPGLDAERCLIWMRRVHR